MNKCLPLPAASTERFATDLQEAPVNGMSDEMDEIVRAMSAENDRLLSASHNAQRRRRSSVSDFTICLAYCFA